MELGKGSGGGSISVPFTNTRKVSLIRADGTMIRQNPTVLFSPETLKRIAVSLY